MSKRITALILATLLFSVSFAGCSKTETPVEDENTTTSAVENSIKASTNPAVEENTATQSADTSATQASTPSSADGNTPTEQGSTQAAQENTVPTAIPDIVNLFNTSANKIKTDAKKVVKNYEKRKLNEDKLVVPESLEKTGRDMISSFMKDDNEPITYSTKEDIRNEYIVPGQSYVSKLDPSYVKAATCTDKGSTYEIVIKLKDQKNPTAGKGIGAVCDVIETGEVADKAPFVKKFATSYYNCEIRATIDKATGKMTHANYKTPLVLDLTVSMFGTHDVAVGFTFEKDYTITY